jgi:cytidine deaminase
MVDKLLKLLNNSKSKYFNFPVSAVVVCNDGREYYGVNVETSSPSAGICAERNALFNAITNGVKKEDIKEIHVMSNKGVFPCFICRQALVDYCPIDTMIFVYDINGLKDKVLLKDLCNYSFSDEDLR